MLARVRLCTRLLPLSVRRRYLSEPARACLCACAIVLCLSESARVCDSTRVCVVCVCESARRARDRTMRVPACLNSALMTRIRAFVPLGARRMTHCLCPSFEYVIV